jgi:threonine aldolase
MFGMEAVFFSGTMANQNHKIAYAARENKLIADKYAHVIIMKEAEPHLIAAFLFFLDGIEE